MRWWREAVWGRHRVLVSCALALVVVGVVCVAYVGVLWSRVNHLDVDLPGSRPGGVTYLFVGSDSRADLTTPFEQRRFGSIRGARADIMLLLRVPSDGSRPVLVSVPRDLLVIEPASAGGLRRLTLTWLDGPQATIDALCRSLGVGVDHLAEVNLKGFADVVDAVGGFDLTLPHALRDSGTLFSRSTPGTYHFNGSAALQYVRSRHLEQATGPGEWVPVPNRRGEQARQVLSAVARNLHLSPLHPLAAYNLASAATGALSIESGAGLGDLRNLADAMRRVQGAKDVQLPVHITAAPIPFAELKPGAGTVLRRVGGGGPGCPRAAFPEARP